MYSRIKEKIKKSLNYNGYVCDFINDLLTMFDSKIDCNLGYDMPVRWYEIPTLLNGKYAIGIVNNEPFYGTVSFVGKLTMSGEMSDALITTANGEKHTFTNWRNNDDIAILFNNINETPVNDIELFADFLTEIDTSIMCNIKNSRYNNILGVRDDRVKKVIESAIEQSNDGKPICITDYDILSNENIIHSIEIHDVKNVDKIQYLTKLHDDFIRRICNKYGMTSQGTSKIAQQTVAEIESGKESSFVTPWSMYVARKKFEKDFNSKFNKYGWSCNYDFSDLWKIQLKNMFASDEESNENTENEKGDISNED